MLLVLLMSWFVIVYFMVCLFWYVVVYVDFIDDEMYEIVVLT